MTPKKYRHVALMNLSSLLASLSSYKSPQQGIKLSLSLEQEARLFIERLILQQSTYPTLILSGKEFQKKYSCSSKSNKDRKAMDRPLQDYN